MYLHLISVTILLWISQIIIKQLLLDVIGHIIYNHVDLDV